MPAYLIRCESCNHEFERICAVSEHGKWGACPSCKSGPVRQVITAPMAVSVDNMPSYVCPVTQKPITSRKARRESFARHGLMDANELGPPPKTTHTPLPSVRVGDEEGADLNAKPSNARKLSRAEDERLTEDIKQAIGIQP